MPAGRSSWVVVPVGADPRNGSSPTHSEPSGFCKSEREPVSLKGQGGRHVTPTTGPWSSSWDATSSRSAAKDAQNETHPEIRAELEFGLLNSQGRTEAHVTANVHSFLAQDDTWRDQAEPALRAARDKAHIERQVNTTALAASATFEVRAVDNAWRGDWERAVQLSERAIAALAGGAELRPYQAFWNYVAAQWAEEAALTTDPTFKKQAEALTKAANAAAARTTWMPNKQTSRNNAGTHDLVEVSALDKYAAKGIVALAREMGTPRKLTRTITTMIEGLNATRAVDYEQALVELGRLLGATSRKPPGEARADALWRWGDHLWIAWEAKSEVKEENSVSAATIRQANTHLRAASADLDEELPPGSISVLVTPQSTVDPSAEALRRRQSVHRHPRRGRQGR